MFMKRLMKRGLGILLVTLLAMLPVVFTPTEADAGTPAVDVLYDGTVVLTPGETFSVTAYNSGEEYTVKKNTPLGALQAAATVSGFTYDVTDKNYAASGALLLDNVGDYPYVKGGSKWYAYVNDVYKDGYNNGDDALNLIELVDGDKVEYYYAAGIAAPADLDAVKAAATAAVKTVVATGIAPTDWTLQLSGAKNASVTKAYFEDALACPSSGHQVTWTDGDGNVWGGVPLWLLVAMVDDDPDVGPYHFNFNDDLAAQNYEVNVIAGDWSATLDSAAIARDDGYIVANTLNGEPLPLETESGKACWPLYLKGPAVFGGQQVGNIVRIELSGLPEPPEGWTLEMIGEVGDTITQEEFEAGLACTGSGHNREWIDIENNVWSGVPLWVLLGAVDDIETGSHWTFNDALAADGYTVKVVAGDDFYKTFDSADVAGSNDYIVANKCNGAPLTEAGPLRLVGAGVTKDDGSLGGSAVGNIVKIEIPELQTPPADPGSWNLALNGKISDVISQAEFEAALACPNSGHLQEWTDGDGNVWSGIPLWFLTGWVDDRQPHDYDANQATAGYTILVKAGDGYTKDFASADVAWSNDYIIANKCNDAPLTDAWPLRLVGAGVASAEGALSGTSVGNIEEIELTSFATAQPIPELRVIKYAEDHTTILDEITVDYLWTQENLEVIGDGTTVYRYEGITNDPNDLWDADEEYPGGYKIENAVKGTRIRDLCELVGGMGAGTEIVLVAKDGYETTLPYSSIYTDPAVQARQGDAILAWWGDGEYVPNYKDGIRLFFTPDDHVYGQWDMHETLPSNYWHYYYDGGIQYPSCAGLSSKLIETIKMYSLPVGDWTLELDGRDIGGLNYDVSKTYFEQALACQFGANHKATYTDSEEQVWEGMPLWFLAGFVDDADQHTDNAFNDALAEDGYQVVITASDGHSVTINSADIIRNSNYIIANSLNGAPIPESDDNWPLRLVGAAVTGSTSISKIVSIELVSSNSTGSSGGGGSSSQAVTSTTGRATVKPGAGGKISLGSEATIKVPANALTGSSAVEVKVQKVTTPPAVPAGFKLAGSVYEFSVDGKNSYNFNKDVVITLSFDPSALAPGEKPEIFYYDEASGQWVSLGGTVSGNTVTVQVDHFTKFAVMIAGKAEAVPSGQVPAALKDITGHWAMDNINQLVALGAISGYPDGTFKPDNSITRAEFAAVLVKAFKLENKGGGVFADTAAHWAKDYIAAAAANGVVNGYDSGTFGPDDLITREQMAVMIVKAAKLPAVAGEPQFADNGSISGWAREAIAAATESGIMKGYPDNTVKPLGNATRAEAVTVIVNALEYKAD
ncbi:Endo-1,4-beta-xylanase A precursor [Pelotomaculum schinkii]|uniref:Endo-1,4-beta-xylanase A n=1 Tax=Pelotomaculum schinkii TaxID=78350 RepID=A0A4Y7RH90_9FIRM|nr:S-layer homology domain-containing protein [Pelotomaculum schinkii]TEB08062.1 Endo-1,4-beta-xylanase A precursor [Pelotomaculum schinkii]